jgi:hypothetical protein
LPTFQTTATTIVTSSPLFPLRFSSNGWKKLKPETWRSLGAFWTFRRKERNTS